MHLYLDCCCYNRPFDDLSQSRVNYESDAIFFILKSAVNGENIILGSTILDIEINRIRNDNKKRHVLNLYKSASKFIPLTDEIEKFAEKIRSDSSVHFEDSLQIASAELGGADIFLTTDDKLIRACKNLSLNMRVVNPLDYVLELIKDEN